LILLTGATGYVGGRLLRTLEALVPGDTLDFWRVEAVEPGRLLRLAAEMRLPGRAWLQFEALWFIHQLVFAGMLRSLVREAEAGGPLEQ